MCRLSLRGSRSRLRPRPVARKLLRARRNEQDQHGAYPRRCVDLSWPSPKMECRNVHPVGSAPQCPLHLLSLDCREKVSPGRHRIDRNPWRSNGPLAGLAPISPPELVGVDGLFPAVSTASMSREQAAHGWSQVPCRAICSARGQDRPRGEAVDRLDRVKAGLRRRGGSVRRGQAGQFHGGPSP